MTPIVAGTVLPANRRPVTLHTADRLALVGELALPADRAPVATTICLHPVPTHGGMMDSHLLRKAANRLPALAGIAVLRFNTRGTTSVQGTSEGEFDKGNAERYDLAAALDLVEYEDLPPPWLVGWAFGADLALAHGLDPSVEGAVLLAPSLQFADNPELDAWAEAGKPVACVVPELDDNLRPAEAAERFARVPQASLVTVAGARHLFVGYTETVLDEIVARVAPEAAPLPRTYS